MAHSAMLASSLSPVLWLLTLLAPCFQLLFSGVCVRTKQGARKGRASFSMGMPRSSMFEESSEEESEEEAHSEGEAEAGQRRRKRKTEEELEAEANQNWANKCAERLFKNERQVDITGFGGNLDFISRIHDQNLDLWFQPLRGYNADLVTDFYSNMEFDDYEHPSIITAMVGMRPIVITPGVIAQSLNYYAPNDLAVNYKQRQYIDTHRIASALYPNPNMAKSPHVPGKFTDEYRIVNQIVHYNLFPRGLENKPSEMSAELMYVFMSSEFTVNWAKFIFREIVQFRKSTSIKARMPYPCMITRIGHNQGLVGDRWRIPEVLTPGPITLGILRRSKAHSTAGGSSSAAASEGFVAHHKDLLRMPAPGAKEVKWYQKLFTLMASLVKKRKKDKARARDMERKMDRVLHETAWQTGAIEQMSGGTVHYQPPTFQHGQTTSSSEDVVYEFEQDD